MRMDNTRCTAGLVFQGMRAFDLPLLAGRLDKVLRLRSFAPGAIEVMSTTHLQMGLGMFDLHLNVMPSARPAQQSPDMQEMDAAISGTQVEADSLVTTEAETSVTLTVTIVKRASDMPSLREAERSIVTAHAALALSTLELAQVLDPDFVQWLQPDMMLQTSSFLSVLEKVTPRRISTADLQHRADAARRKRPQPLLPLSQPQANHVTRLFPDIDTTLERLEHRSVSEKAQGADMAQSLSSGLPLLHEAEPPAPAEVERTEPTVLTRIAVWALSFIVALISLPVGLALMVYNLLRGEDLRLAMIALALTGLISALVTAGITDQAVTMLGNLPVVGQMLTQMLV